MKKSLKKVPLANISRGSHSFFVTKNMTKAMGLHHARSIYSFKLVKSVTLGNWY